MKTVGKLNILSYCYITVLIMLILCLSRCYAYNYKHKEIHINLKSLAFDVHWSHCHIYEQDATATVYSR